MFSRFVEFLTQAGFAACAIGLGALCLAVGVAAVRYALS